ncbi:MAG TPA: hypothetical protein VKG84_10245 [Candidatus Acidoferrales bacterium]|nr:hypothetical protein [Candidatus Acidoferrales bacterium]
MNIKHPIVLSFVILWVVLAIWPKLATSQAPKQDPATLRIAMIILAIAHFAFWYFLP